MTEPQIGDFAEVRRIASRAACRSLQLADAGPADARPCSSERDSRGLRLRAGWHAPRAIRRPHAPRSPAQHRSLPPGARASAMSSAPLAYATACRGLYLVEDERKFHLHRPGLRQSSAPSTRRPDLQVRRARSATRPRAEQRTPQIRRATAASANDPARRMLERSLGERQHSSLAEHCQRPPVFRRRGADIACLDRRRAAGRSDLEFTPSWRRSAKPGGRCELGEVEVTKLATTAQMQAARRVEEAGELGSRSQPTLRLERGQLATDALGKHLRDSSSRRLYSTPSEPYEPSPLLRRRRDGRERRPGSGCAHRRFRPLAGRSDVRRAQLARRT